MIFISVNTPTKVEGFGAGFATDLKWIESSARKIAEYSKGHTIVIEKSTVPVKTAKLIETILVANKKITPNEPPKTFAILSSPEFLSEGTAIKDLENPDRVLIGGDDDNAIRELKMIYKYWINEEKYWLQIFGVVSYLNFQQMLFWPRELVQLIRSPHYARLLELKLMK